MLYLSYRPRPPLDEFVGNFWLIEGVAVACGYFDQSHLIRDFKEFSGSTPNIYSIQQQHKDARLKDNHVPLQAT